MRVQYCLEGMKSQQGGRRILLDNNSIGGWGGHAGADWVPVFWSLDFKWASLYILVHTGMTTYMLYAICAKFDLRRNFRNVNIA